MGYRPPSPASWRPRRSPLIFSSAAASTLASNSPGSRWRISDFKRSRLQGEMGTRLGASRRSPGLSRSASTNLGSPPSTETRNLCSGVVSMAYPAPVSTLTSLRALSLHTWVTLRGSGTPSGDTDTRERPSAG
jgi:hypothetical protein